MKYKAWSRDNGTEFYELIDSTGFAIGTAYTENAAKIFIAAPELLEACRRALRELKDGEATTGLEEDLASAIAKAEDKE
jgi:hypothetical protein